MLSKEYQNQIKELGKNQPWNHQYIFNDFKTKDKLQNSPANNIIKWKRIKDILKTQNIDINNKKILDLGCSDGYFSIEMSKLGAKNVIGIDTDSLRIKRSKLIKQITKISNIEFKVENVYDLPNVSKYDIVLALGFLHRIPDMYWVLEKISKISSSTIIEFKSLKSDDAICKWMGGKTKSNIDNALYFIPSNIYVKEILIFFGFSNVHIFEDTQSKLNYTRTIIYARK